MTDFSPHQMKVVLISSNNDYKITTLKFPVMDEGKAAGRVVFTRSIFIENIKYILERYDYKKDCLYYRQLYGNDPMMKKKGDS